MKCIAILKDVVVNIFAMWVFFIYGGLSLAGTVILIGSIPGWDVFSVVIGLFYLAYLGVVLLRLIVSNIPSVRSRLKKKDTWAVFIARHYYMVSLWFAWGFILLCLFFLISSELDPRSLKAIGVIWGGGSAVLLGWLIWSTVWPMGVWAVKGLGKDQGNMDAAQQSMNDSMEALKEYTDKDDEAKTLNRLSKAAFEQGDLETALKHASASLAMAEETGDEDGKAIILTNISQAHIALGQIETALACLEKSLALARNTGNKTCEGKALDIMGNIYKGREEYDLALSYFEQALSIEKTISDKDGEGDTLNSIALIFLLRNDGDTAKYFLDQSIAIRRDLEDKIGEAANLINLSRCHELKGDFETASECLEQSLALNQETGNKVATIAVYHNMAHAALDQGEYGKALTLWEKALDLAVETQHAQGIFHVASTLGRVLAKSGHVREAGIVLKLASETGHAAGFPGVTAIDELLNVAYKKQRDTLDLNDFLSCVPVMKSEKDLVTAGLWLHPVQVKKPLPQYENIIKDRTRGLIGWMYPVSADIFDMTKELPVMFDKVDGDVVSVGIPIGELELIHLK